VDRCRSLLLTFIIAALLAPNQTRAATLVVGPPGEADYPTIQEAIAACAEGDTVLISPGTYTGPNNRNIDLGENQVIIRPADGLGSVTIDCLEMGRAFTVRGGQDTTSVIMNLVIVNGFADHGGGILVENGGGVKILNCDIHACKAPISGNAVEARGEHLILRSVRVQNCGPATGYACVNVTAGSCRLVDCLFEDNRNGTLWVSGAVCRVWDSRFERCEGAYGAGVRAEGGATVSLNDCVFRENTGWRGAAVYAESSAVQMDHCTMTDNYVVVTGSALYAVDSSLTLSRCELTRNKCNAADGAAVRIAGGAMGPSSFSNCTITAFQCGGQDYGFFGIQDVDVVIERCALAFCQTGPVATLSGSGITEFMNCVVYEIPGGDTLPGNAHDNLFVDPLFCGIYDDDLDLCANSPCLPEQNLWGVSVGAREQGCGECSTPVKATSWGAIKALYR